MGFREVHPQRSPFDLARYNEGMNETNFDITPVVAVSACLLGRPCRFDGASKPCEQAIQFARYCKVVPICPEVAGGFPIPHPPCEIEAGTRPVRVVDATGADVTQRFHAGASRCLEQLRDADCRVAVLKSKSPSCGSGQVYDGSFTGTLVEGWGVAAALLRDAGVDVLDETQVDRLLEPLRRARVAHNAGEQGTQA